MTADLAFECLLVCRDPALFTTINRILRNLSISTNICLSSGRAFEQLAGGGTDLIVIDWEGDASAELLRQIRQWNRWKKPIIVAISNGNLPLSGIHVVLEKPVTDDSGTQSLKRAYSRMLHDHRRYARHALMMSVIAADDNHRAIPVTITNIGQGGVGLNSNATLMIGDELSFRMLLPGTKRDISVHVRVLWTREYGSVGCEFLRISPVDLIILHEWLKVKTRVKKPLLAVSERCSTGEEME